jgi:hypothetical protein
MKKIGYVCNYKISANEEQMYQTQYAGNEIYRFERREENDRVV